LSERVLEDPFSPSPHMQSLFEERKQEAMLTKGQVINGRVKIIDDVLQVQNAASQFRKENEDLARQLRKEAGRGCLARVSEVPNSYRTILDKLMFEMPNFESVIQKIRAELTLASITRDKVFRLETPLLLVGPAGVGKTHFVNELADRLGLLTERVSCSDSSAGFVLSGLTSGFGTGQPGQIYKTIVGKRVANPILILDEIDKSSVDDNASHQSFENVFYNLLEPISSRSYKDECMQIEFDASHICWLATANNLDAISAPIRDRFNVVEVAYPSISERQMICRNLYEKMLQTHAWGSHFSEFLEDDIVSLLSSKETSVRQLKRYMYEAFASAAEEAESRGCNQLDKIELRGFHFNVKSTNSHASRIGFIQ